MLEPGDPDFAAFGGKNGGNGVHDEVEDELDAFNDETFGGGADEWVEEAHEELAQLTEEVGIKYTRSVAIIDPLLVFLFFFTLTKEHILMIFYRDFFLTT